MPYFALFYDTVDNFVERRQPFRQAHLEMIDAAYRGGVLVLAGALKPAAAASAGGAPEITAGALLVFRADDATKAEAFARADPYVANGLVRGWRILEWSVVVGDHAVPR